MSKVIDGVKYTKTHEWVRSEGDFFIIGVTDFAQSELSDVVYADLAEAGEEVVAGGGIGVLESVKAAAEIYSPVTGKIVAVNEELTDSPQFINDDPYGDGWLVKIAADSVDEYENLISPEDYEIYLKK